MNDYLHPAMKQLLDQQARFAPRDARMVQVDRAEQLLAEVQPDRQYPYQYVCYRITDFRTTKYPKLLLDGGQLQHDLRMFVEDLSDSMDMPAKSVDEPVWTTEDLGRMFNVSTKTVARWRERGLVSRRFVIDGRKRVAFLKSSVGRFVRSNPDTIRRGSRFSQLNGDEKLEILRRARRLAHAGGCLGEVSRRVARKLKRSPETIRYTLRNHDREHPEAAKQSAMSISSIAAVRRSTHSRSGFAARGRASTGSSTRCGLDGSWSSRSSTCITRVSTIATLRS
jgi:hypothetical protein